MSLIVLYLLHSTSVLSFYIDVVLTLSIATSWYGSYWQLLCVHGELVEAAVSYLRNLIFIITVLNIAALQHLRYDHSTRSPLLPLTRIYAEPCLQTPDYLNVSKISRHTGNHIVKKISPKRLPPSAILWFCYTRRGYSKCSTGCRTFHSDISLFPMSFLHLINKTLIYPR